MVAVGVPLWLTARGPTGEEVSRRKSEARSTVIESGEQVEFGG
jgi:hypothetical protein